MINAEAERSRCAPRRRTSRRRRGEIRLSAGSRAASTVFSETSDAERPAATARAAPLARHGPSPSVVILPSEGCADRRLDLGEAVEDLVVAEPQHPEAERAQYRVTPPVRLERGRRIMEAATVDFDDQPAADQEVDSSYAGDRHLASRVEASKEAMPHDELDAGLADRIRGGGEESRGVERGRERGVHAERRVDSRESDHRISAATVVDQSIHRFGDESAAAGATPPMHRDVRRRASRSGGVRCASDVDAPVIHRPHPVGGERDRAGQHATGCDRDARCRRGVAPDVPAASCARQNAGTDSRTNATLRPSGKEQLARADGPSAHAEERGQVAHAVIVPDGRSGGAARSLSCDPPSPRRAGDESLRRDRARRGCATGGRTRRKSRRTDAHELVTGEIRRRAADSPRFATRAAAGCPARALSAVRPRLMRP